MSGTVIVFDFDKTIVDVDSDNWVIDELGFTDLFNQLLPTMPWNSLMVSISCHVFVCLFVFFFFCSKNLDAIRHMFLCCSSIKTRVLPS